MGVEKSGAPPKTKTKPMEEHTVHITNFYLTLAIKPLISD